MLKSPPAGTGTSAGNSTASRNLLASPLFYQQLQQFIQQGKRKK
ncbi:hypothetical protein [Aquitalea magnusonii]|nr:hypothetical protein [Aquitalea magnusonii]